MPYYRVPSWTSSSSTSSIGSAWPPSRVLNDAHSASESVLHASLDSQLAQNVYLSPTATTTDHRSMEQINYRTVSRPESSITARSSLYSAFTESDSEPQAGSDPSRAPASARPLHDLTRDRGGENRSTDETSSTASDTSLSSLPSSTSTNLLLPAAVRPFTLLPKSSRTQRAVSHKAYDDDKSLLKQTLKRLYQDKHILLRSAGIARRYAAKGTEREVERLLLQLVKRERGLRRMLWRLKAEKDRKSEGRLGWMKGWKVGSRGILLGDESENKNDRKQKLVEEIGGGHSGRRARVKKWLRAVLRG